MKNLLARMHTFTMLTSRLVAIALFAAILLAAPFHAALAQTAPNLLTAGSFAVLGGTTVTNDGASLITGNLGVSPGTGITGFDLTENTIVYGAGGTVTTGLGIVTGTIYAGGPVAAQAHIDAVIAYNYLMDQPALPANSYSGVTQLDGLTLTPGVYKFAPSANLKAGGTLYLNFQGNNDALFIFQMGTTLVTEADSKVIAINTEANSQTCLGSNVYWAVGSSATINGAEFLGTVIAHTTITMTSAANTSGVTYVTGRMLALGGEVTMVTDNISICGSFPPPPVPPPGEDPCQDCSDNWSYYWNNYWYEYWKDNCYCEPCKPCKDCCKDYCRDHDRDYWKEYWKDHDKYHCKDHEKEYCKDHYCTDHDKDRCKYNDKDNNKNKGNDKGNQKRR